MDPARRAKWRELLKDVDPETAAHDRAWEFDAPTWMFHAFRPSGRGVEPFFPEGTAGRAAARRLRRVFAAVPDEPRMMYLVPPRRDVEPHALERKVRAHLARVRGLVPRAIEAGELQADDPGLALLRPDEIVVGPRSTPKQPDDDDGVSLLYVVAAWYGRAREEPKEACWDLREPLYGLACEYELANYVLAPLLGDGDPFAPWFWLWRHGLGVDRFERRGDRVRVVLA